MRRAARCGLTRLTSVSELPARGPVGRLGSGSGPVLVVVPQRARAAHRGPTTRTNHGDLLACVAHGLRKESEDRRCRGQAPVLPWTGAGGYEHGTADGHDDSWFRSRVRVPGRGSTGANSAGESDTAHRGPRAVYRRNGPGSDEPAR